MNKDIFSSEILALQKEHSIPSLNLSIVKFEDGKGKRLFSYENGKISDETKFFAQSVSKVHVKIGILKMIEDNLLSLEDKIFNWIDPVTSNAKNVINYYDWNRWSKITVKDCLLHTSGIPDFMNEISDFAYYNDNSLQNFNWVDILRAIGKYPLHFDPGTDESYSNSNFYILITIAELILKKKWKEIVKELVLIPGNCKNSDSVDFKSSEMWDMIGYYYENGEIKQGDEWQNSMAKGLIYTTIKDLHSLSYNLLRGKIISPRTIKMFFDDKKNPIGGLGAGDTGSIVYYLVDQESKKSMVFVTDLFKEELIDKIVELGDKIFENV